MEKGAISWKNSRGAIVLSWLLLSLLLFQACGDTPPERAVKQHFNIHLVIDQTETRKGGGNFRNHDTVIASTVIDYFVQKLFSRGSKSSLSYQHFTNTRYFKDFPTLSLNEIQGDTALLQEKIHELRKHISHFCREPKENASGDIFKYLEKRLVKEKGVIEDSMASPGRVLIHRQIPVIVLITDGYIYWNQNQCKGPLEKPCKCLNEARVKKYRSSYDVWKKEANNTAFDFKDFLNQGKVGGLEPFNNPQLKDAIFLVLELEDKSLMPSGSSKYDPSDMDILEAVWQKWLLDSGVKNENIHFLTTSHSLEDIQGLLEDVLVTTPS